ncbi:MAG: helix-turn-helix domain-containing protein [Tsuneonella sp.]
MTGPGNGVRPLPDWTSRLAPDPRLVIWPPSADLAPYVTGYHLYAVGDIGDEPHRGAFEPAGASLRFAVVNDWWKLRPAKANWMAPPVVSLFGPSSSLIWSESGPGILVGVGIRPRGWARMFAQPASEWADRIDVPPPLGKQDAESMLAILRVVDNDDDVARALEHIVRGALRPPSADDPLIGAIEAALVDPEIRTAGELGEVVGIPSRRLQRLAHRAFGFSPRLLLRRARFLRSLHALRAASKEERASAIDEAYTDYSHFVRDSHDFLGMSPQAFLTHDMPLLKSSLELRTQVLGTPAQALDPSPVV